MTESCSSSNTPVCTTELSLYAAEIVNALKFFLQIKSPAFDSKPLGLRRTRVAPAAFMKDQAPLEHNTLRTIPQRQRDTALDKQYCVQSIQRASCRINYLSHTTKLGEERQLVRAGYIDSSDASILALHTLNHFSCAVVLSPSQHGEIGHIEERTMEGAAPGYAPRWERQ